MDRLAGNEKVRTIKLVMAFMNYIKNRSRPYLSMSLKEFVHTYYSVEVNERKDMVYDKINRRLGHLTSMSTDSSKKESENMLVRIKYCLIDNQL